MDLTSALAALRERNEPTPIPARLPTTDEIDRAESSLGLTFPADYRRYLAEASDVAVPTLEPAVVTPDGGHRDLVGTAELAWEAGVPEDWLAFCSDDGDYFCLDGDKVRFWSHDGGVHEWWPDLATWIVEVWIERR